MHFQRGVSFIEVLISLFIFSVFLLGFDAMQITSLREIKSAYYFATAMTQLNNMVERLNLLKGRYSDEQVTLWNNQIKTVLPQGRGLIKKQSNYFVITILWGDIKEETCKKNKIGQSGCLTEFLKI